MKLQKPRRLERGDTVATLSVSHGWAGDSRTFWKYETGRKRLAEWYGLRVIPAPHSMRGTEYLEKNPKARAEDILWAFENKEVSALIANMGGNDGIRVLPFLKETVIRHNPKIFVGYSDVLCLHLFCFRCGLSSFYGPNLLPTIAENGRFHPYTAKWFYKTLFEPAVIGKIEPSADWSVDAEDYENPQNRRSYRPNPGVRVIQGKGTVRGRLLGGHTGLMEWEHTPAGLKAEDFDGALLFLEDIPEFLTPEGVGRFFRWLGKTGALSLLTGVLIGRAAESLSFGAQEEKIRRVLEEYGLTDLPVLYGFNFGHSSPMFTLPFGALAELSCEEKSLTILESGVI